MPVKYVGRVTDFSGKTLWEIVGNLKDFGVGRLVKRHMLERYPEPSFIRIVKVDAAKNEEPRKVRVWAEKVFRGQRYPKLVEVYSVSYKADYRLVPKHEEKALWERVDATPNKEKLLPEYMDFPPLMKVSSLQINDLICFGLWIYLYGHFYKDID
ncbi:hypothetical protein AAG570_013706 [Ranatra chinensis]|uniref:Mitochondrial ribosomal protein S34 n=1 Tax=Ranatra chinensis TaxID=642074 RepID=A0ABD0YCY7_9HEMI